MFERFRKEAPGLQLYGKLPLAKDYLRVGASKGAGRDLREWLDQAFSPRTARSRAPSFAWPARFLLGAVDGDPLMGIVWPSSDRGGERAFPFTLFVERRRKALVQSFQNDPAQLAAIWRCLRDYHDERDRFDDGQSFLAGMRGRTVAIAPRSKEEPGGTAGVGWQAWVDALWPDDGQEGIVGTLRVLARLSAENHRGPLRLPLVGNLPLAPQVHGWWSALRALELVREDEPPTVFFPDRESDDPAAAPAFATFLRSALRVDHAPWVACAPDRGALGEGDLAPARCVLARADQPLPENAPPLAVSMRGALATARARG